MATAFTHGFIGVALSTLSPRPIPMRLSAVVAATVAVLPDIDVLAFRFGIPYGDVFGHRGFTHSIVFSVLVALLCSLLFIRYVKIGSLNWVLLVLLLFLAGISHGLLDAFTDTGLGVGFFIPFDDGRHFFTVRPLETSPVSIRRFFSGDFVAILQNEFIWVWLPTLLVLMPLWLWRSVRKRYFSEM